MPLATSSISPLQELWEKEYETSDTPFDIEEPDEWITALAKSGKIHGNVLDAGCGPGRNSLCLAEMGCDVLGVDISANAIERARQKASAKNNSARFLQANLCQLSDFEDYFDAVVDIGCFHSLDQRDRAAYAAALHRYCRDGAAVYLRAFRWAHPGGSFAPDLIEQDIRAAFSTSGWIVKELVEKEIELYISETEQSITSCWFAEMSYEPWR
jgi:cyclopropane fatty-acyl-phospholipid synthase-like methyltransferase